MKLLLIVLPAFLIFATGYIGQKRLKLDIKPVSTMSLYLMTPFLTFNTFYTNKLNGNFIYFFIFNILLILFLVVITFVIGKFIKSDKTSLSAMLLSTNFPNMGNYGAPVALFAFGQTAFNFAVITMVIQGMLLNTIGIFIASFGSEKSTNIKTALMNVVKMPVLYGMIAGILFQLLHIKIPPTIDQSINMVGMASIPTVMLILGMQLAEIKAEKIEWKYMSTITFVRIVISPLVTAFFVSLMPISTVMKDVFILLSAMPISATSTLLAVQFDTKPNLVSLMTLITTLISLVSIPVTIYLIG